MPRVTFGEIRYDVAGPIATITLDRPDRLNAVTGRTIDELLAAFDAADADGDVRAVIVTGAGRAFCAGADLAAGGQTFERARVAPEEHRDGGGRVTLRIFDLTKPVIAAINGPAVGFGITLTLAMDVRLASSAARMGFVFARRGVVPEACSTWFLPRLVGIARAAEWVLTGRVFGAEEARAAGLVSRVVAPEALLPAARELAHEIAANTSAVSVALARQMLWRMLGAAHPAEAHRIDSLAMWWTGRSADAREGIAAFLEKRAPRFPLRVGADLPPFYPWWTAGAAGPAGPGAHEHGGGGR
jgi:enoyl-CoA hydratase/carnithine racemase